MPAALLAAFALCNMPLYLYPQQALPEAAWPTHAVVTVPQGWIQPGHKLYVLENGEPMLAQVEVVARWPDGSPKWLHAYGTFRYEGGQPAKYELIRGDGLPEKMPASPLVVRDDAAGIHIDTGAVKLLVPRPFVGISVLSEGDKAVVQGDGGPFVVDGDGTLWQARYDREAEIVVEQQGPARVTVKATGWYQTPEPRADAFCRFTTRITAFAGSPLVKIDHAATFADNMKKHDVAELGFKVALNGGAIVLIFHSPGPL